MNSCIDTQIQRYRAADTDRAALDASLLFAAFCKFALAAVRVFGFTFQGSIRDVSTDVAVVKGTKGSETNEPETRPAYLVKHTNTHENPKPKPKHKQMSQPDTCHDKGHSPKDAHPPNPCSCPPADAFECLEKGI